MIRGYFDVRQRSALPNVWVGLVLPHRTAAFTPVEFVVDIGAAVSVLHPADARGRLQFSPSDFATLPRIAHEQQALVGITGPANYFVVPARYIFAHEDGRPQVIEGEIRIAQPIPGNIDIPSVLGWDILRQFRLILDQRTSEVWLDDASP